MSIARVILATAAIVLFGAQSAACSPRENLALGKPYTLSLPPADTWYPILERRGDSWPDLSTVLTDGKRARTRSFWTNNKALNFTEMGQVEVRIDLGETRSIGEVRAHHMARPIAGIRLHASDEFFVGDNGVDWTPIGEFRNDWDPPDPADRRELKSGRVVYSTGRVQARGRYVLVRSRTWPRGRLRLRPYVGFDEIEVLEGAGVPTGVAPTSPAVSTKIAEGDPVQRVDWVAIARETPILFALAPQHLIGDDEFHLSVGGTFVIPFDMRRLAEGAVSNLEFWFSAPVDLIVHEVNSMKTSVRKRRVDRDGRSHDEYTLRIATEDLRNYRWPWFVVSSGRVTPANDLGIAHYRYRYELDGVPYAASERSFRLVLDSEVTAPAPRRFLTGFWIPYRARTLRSRDTLDRLMAFYAALGFNAANGGESSPAIHAALRSAGLADYTGANLSPNALMFAKFMKDVQAEIPAEDRFVHHPKARRKDPGMCPTKFVHPRYDALRKRVAAKILKNSDHVYENWEPFMFHKQGCICDACREAFQAYSGWPDAAMDAAWPDIVVDTGSPVHNAFTSRQFGEVMRTLQRSVGEAGEDLGRTQRPSYVPSLSPKYFEPGSESMRIHDPREFLGDLDRVMVWRYDNAGRIAGATAASTAGNNLSMLPALRNVLDVVRAQEKRPEVYFLGTERFQDLVVLPADSFFMSVFAYVLGFDGAGAWGDSFKQDARYLRAQARAHSWISRYEDELAGRVRVDDAFLVDSEGPRETRFVASFAEVPDASGDRIALGNDAPQAAEIRVRLPGRTPGPWRLEDAGSGAVLGRNLSAEALASGVIVPVGPKGWRLIQVAPDSGVAVPEAGR